MRIYTFVCENNEMRHYFVCKIGDRNVIDEARTKQTNCSEATLCSLLSDLLCYFQYLFSLLFSRMIKENETFSFVCAEYTAHSLALTYNTIHINVDFGLIIATTQIVCKFIRDELSQPRQQHTHTQKSNDNDNNNSTHIYIMYDTVIHRQYT